MLVRGRLGEPQGYLSDDQTEVFTDYRLNDPVILFERRPQRPTDAGATRTITVTQRGGTVDVHGKMFTDAHDGLRPLKPGIEVLCLLKQA
jgi:hypothetical protein